MKNIKKTLVLMTAALVLGTGGWALAQSGHEGHGHGAVPKPAQGEVVVTVTGTLRCASCELKKKKGAASQCALHGCQFSFGAEKIVNEAGKRLKKLEGKLYHILVNDQSKPLLQKENKGKRFSVTGKVYGDERVIEIVTFAPAIAL